MISQMEVSGSPGIADLVTRISPQQRAERRFVPQAIRLAKGHNGEGRHYKAIAA
jgi:hypothetical protein